MRFLRLSSLVVTTNVSFAALGQVDLFRSRFRFRFEGVDYLLDDLSHERETMVRWAIGRALRMLSGDDRFYRRILRVLVSHGQHSESMVAAYAETAGWLTSGLTKTLHMLARQSNHTKVRELAGEAIRRRRDFEEVRTLLIAYKQNQGAETWSTLEGIVALGDPELLRSNDDKLSIWTVLRNSPPMFRDHARRLLKEREKELEKIARKRDQDLEWRQ